MVFFTCSSCGESLKKNQVPKHISKCRNCYKLSCVDCGKDFCGDEYNLHTKCITEEEKYGGLNYKAKPNANKGERKQEAWVEKINLAVQKAPASDKPLKDLLGVLSEYSNVPRKQAKFENFMRSCLRVYDTRLVSRVWGVMNELMKEEKEVHDATDRMNGTCEEGKSTPSQETDNLKTCRKRKHSEEDNADELNGNAECFDWRLVVKDILEKNGSPMPLEKLRKKVLKCCQKSGMSEKESQKMEKKFEKRLSKEDAYSLYDVKYVAVV